MTRRCEWPLYRLALKSGFLTRAPKIIPGLDNHQNNGYYIFRFHARPCRDYRVDRSTAGTRVPLSDSVSKIFSRFRIPPTVADGLNPRQLRRSSS